MARAPCAVARSASETTDVIVIGAGPSGSRAALDMEEQGLSVQADRRAERVGGRPELQIALDGWRATDFAGWLCIDIGAE